MDRSLVCRECGVSFVFTQGEQEFFQSRGLTNPPSRCPKCRAVRRAQQAGTVTAEFVPSAPRPMIESRPMYPATCARCGQQTQVPFQPRGDRPVYCSACFHAERPAPGRTAVATRVGAPRMSATSVMSIAPTFVEPAPDEGARPVSTRPSGPLGQQGARAQRPLPALPQHSDWIEEDEE